MGSDNLSRSAGTDDEFESSDCLSFPIVGSHCIDSGEDVVEVDDATDENVGPFTIGELRAPR
jgi:hypothetical protein